MILGCPSETFPGEQRVAISPSVVPALKKQGIEVIVQAGAGKAAGYPDHEYQAKGAAIVSSREEVFAQAYIVAQVRAGGANPQNGEADLPLLNDGKLLIAQLEPLTSSEALQKLAKTGVSAFALELMPRITRAQSMDVLSSQATIGGYKAVLLAASYLPKMFPMLMTAAGTVTAARAFIIGAGVAGLQAIATARKLGAVVQAYDIRPAVKEQVQSLGAKFVELELEAGKSEDKGGYAKAMDEDFYRRQREMMTTVVSQSDVVITTAAVPGKKAPVLITGEMVRAMPFGSIIIDLAAERGGNCQLTRPGETITENGVTIMGPLNLPSTVPYHASQMYAKNLTTFLLSMVRDGSVQISLEDEVIRETLVARGGEIVNPKVPH